MHMFILSCALIAAGAVSGAVAVPPPPRTEAPIRLVTLSDGTRRYAVRVTVDGLAMDAGLDTGSTGLRVLARALPAQVSAHGGAESYHYGSGLKVDGGRRHMTIAIGAVAGGDVPVQRIDRIGCVEGKSGCPGDTLSLADFGLQGDGLKGEGFPAILGINMADAGVPNPFVAMGVTRWIVELPRPGSDAPGRLILDPDDAEVAGYMVQPLMPQLADVKGGVHDAVAGCLIRTDTKDRLCGPVLFDTGAPGIRVSVDRAGAMWPNGTAGTLVLGDGRSALAFTVGRRDQASAMIAERHEPGAVPRISAGVMPYFGWSVLYDVRRGAIGLKPR